MSLRAVMTTRQAMQQALALADEAARMGEVPVGAVVLDGRDRVLGMARNYVEEWHDASAHAELLAMREAARQHGSARLAGCTLVVTLEPCPMCAAAITHFRIRRLIYGAYDPKGGAVDHGPRLFHRPTCLHRPEEVISGVRERDAGERLRLFFRALRGKAGD
ncbi:nucleoside deaminase [Bombella sp. TMW 2.2559]|uniref:tRNA-specific adenosine deaminase n=1 Tax=Bombella dulcis TaxID=2967339 RepID=A0ABT3WEG5_9PROT|nr:nucleoside deaminase [Bombella dulcis]MCX5616187.1 nucleoside deaminase [Bombella dulcis]